MKPVRQGSSAVALQLFVFFWIYIIGQGVANAVEGFAVAPDSRILSGSEVSNLGYAVHVEKFELSQGPAIDDVEPGMIRIAVSVRIENVIDPDLVFDEGFDEEVVLHGFEKNGPFLRWNQAVATLDAAISANENPLRDPVVLPYVGDSISGKLIYTVPEVELLSRVELVFSDELFGGLTVSIVKPADHKPNNDTSADEWQHNSPLAVSLTNVEISDDAISLVLSTIGGKIVDSAAVEAGTVVASNLSGLRLLIPGNEPLLPDFVPEGSAQSHLPIASLPNEIVSYPMTFYTPLAADAPDIALVLPVKPPEHQQDEPFWIVEVRGNLPSLLRSDSDDAPSPVAQGNESGDKVDTNSRPAVKPVYAPPWPAPPVLADNSTDYIDESMARRKQLITVPASNLSNPGVKTDEAGLLQIDDVIGQRFDGKDRVHYYDLPLDSSSQLYEVHVVTDAARPLRIELLHEGSESGWKTASRRTSDDVIQELDLNEPLKLSVTTSKAGIAYKLALYQTGMRADGGAFEPSDIPTLTRLPTYTATGSQNSLEWQGRFDADNDVDFFRLSVAAPKLASLEVVPRGKFALYGENGEIGRSQTFDDRSIMADVLLLSGVSLFAVTQPRGKPISNYAVKATFHPLPDPSHEHEPNDSPALAHRLTPGLARTGRLPTKGDRDWYFFDWPGTGAASLVIRGIDSDALKIELTDSLGQLKPEVLDDGTFGFSLHRGHYQLNLSSSKPGLEPYRILLSHAAMVSSESSLISATLLDYESVLQPYSAYPQSVSTQLTLKNYAAVDQELTLSAESAHDCCTVQFEKNTINLAAGETATVGVTLLSRRDSASRAPFPIDIRVAGEQLAAQSVRWQLSFDYKAKANFNDWGDYPLPASMMGAWDVARIDFGAYPVDQISCTCSGPIALKQYVAGSNPYSLKSNLCTAAFHGGLIDSQGGAVTAELYSKQSRFIASESNGVTSRSSGTENLSVKMSSHSGNPAQQCPRRFELSNKASVNLLSGLATTSRFEGQSLVVALAARSMVSGFILDTLGTGLNQAKDISISLSDDGEQFVEVSRLTLRQQKGITTVPLNNSTSARYARIELLSGYGPSKDRFHLGSFKVLAQSTSSPVFADGANLSLAHLGFEVFEDEAQSRTVAFHHKRLAEIQSLSLLNTGAKPIKVGVSSSRYGPFGPWVSVGEMQLSSDVPQTLPLNTVSARYLRISSDSKLKKNLEILSIIERPNDENYRSILGEWGEESSAAHIEWFSLSRPSDNPRVESSQANPVDARVGERYTSTVSINSAVADYFRVKMPDDQQDLILTISGDPYLRTAISVVDGKGQPIDGISESAVGRQSVRYQIPNNGVIEFVNVIVADTPRHLAVLWDDSGSVAPFIPGTQKLIRNLAFELDKDWEKLHLTPLHLKRNEPFLTTEWTTDPYAVTGAIRRYRTTGSSKSYVTIENALKHLEEVNGMRALLIVTDERGDRSDYPGNKIEKLLAEVGPTTFSFHVSGNIDLHSEHINHMQTFAGLNGGRYSRLTDPDDIPEAFAKVQGWLRRPAGYTLAIDAMDAIPGELQVRFSDKNTEPGNALDAAAVEVIFDASGSMWKKLADGSLRIAVAKQVLTDLVVDLLPEAIPFALRVFGHKKPRSCQTHLDIPLAPLDRKQTLGVVGKINPQDRSKTPIAASLAAIESDLSSAKGQRLVILITDGEETCNGDPPQAIKDLKAAGVDVQINIVGLDIQSEKTSEQFKQWAGLGGGDYFTANNAEQLRQSLSDALQPKFVIYNDRNEMIATGRVGDTAVRLPAGKYRVTIAGTEQTRRVNVIGGALNTVLVD